MHSVACFIVSGCAAWWSMTIIGALAVLIFSARLSSCWMVFVSNSMMASAFSVFGCVLMSMGRYCSRCFESRLIPWAAPISVSSAGLCCFSKF